MIDEIGYLTLRPEQVNAFFKLMKLRYARKATILTTNLDYPEWYELFKRKPLVNALLDRLRHHCITVRIKGPSLGYRKNKLASRLRTSPQNLRKSELALMDIQPTFSFLFPPSLFDETAYEIAEFLQALSLAFEERYFGQIRRHRRTIHLKRNLLIEPSWEEDDGRSF